MGEICKHRWADDYTCSVCGSDKQAKIPMWVLATKIKRGPRAVLVALWTFADQDTSDPRPIWPLNETVAKRAGQLGISTLSTHLAWLLEAGWIRTRDTRRREFDLAWKAPFAPGDRTPGNRKTGQTLPKNRIRKTGRGGPILRCQHPGSSGRQTRKIGTIPISYLISTDQLPIKRARPK